MRLPWQPRQAHPAMDKCISAICAARASQSSAVRRRRKEVNRFFRRRVRRKKHCSGRKCVALPGNPNKAQRSGFVWERRGKGAK